jgi:hypothetical protein
LSNYEKRCSNRYYKSIEDLPVYNWWKLKETKDFKHLLIDSNKKVNRYAVRTFKAIDNEFINVFGIDRRFELYLDKLIKLTLINSEIARTKDRSKKIFADILEFEIEEILTDEEKNAFNDKGFSTVSKYLGSSVKIKEITVYEFYSHIEAIKREIKQS